MHGGAPDLTEPQAPQLRLRARLLRRRRPRDGGIERYRRLRRRRSRGATGFRRLLTAIPILGLAVVVAALLVFEPIQSVTGTTPADSVTIERTVLRPGQIELHVRNDGQVDTTIAQVLVNDAYWDHTTGDRELGRFEGTTVTLRYLWEEGIPLHLAVLTGAGTVVEHVVDNPTEAVRLDGDTAVTLGWVGLLVAPIPVALGLAWLPALRRSTGRVLGAVMAFTLGLLAFLLVDSAAEGLESAAETPDLFDGVGLFAVGALVALVVIAAAGALGHPRPTQAHAVVSLPGGHPAGSTFAVDPGPTAVVRSPRAGDGDDGHLGPEHHGDAAPPDDGPDHGDRTGSSAMPPYDHDEAAAGRGDRPEPGGVVVVGGERSGGVATAIDDQRRAGHERAGVGGAVRLAWLVAAGIGLHNLGEGLAVGAAINSGEVALGTTLVVAFAIHNVTEGVAIAGPLGTATRTRALMLAGLVAVAGLPVFPGLWLGGFVLPAGWAALAFGVAAGAIAEVLWSVFQWLRQRGVTLTPLTAGAFAAAVLFMYVTGLAAT